MFKAKRLIEKGGVPATSTMCSDHLSRQFLITASTFPYALKIPQPNIFTLWSPQQTISDHHLYLSIRSKNSSAEYIHTLPACLTLINTLTHTETCIKSVNMFGWGIFGAIRKCRDGGQELSAEVTRAPGWGSWNPPFSINLFALTHWPFCAPIGVFFCWYPPFPCYTKGFTCRSEVTLNPCISITNQDFEK